MVCGAIISTRETNAFLFEFQSHYPILYRGVNGTVAHEFIVDLRPLKVSRTHH